MAVAKTNNVTKTTTTSTPALTTPKTDIKKSETKTTAVPVKAEVKKEEVKASTPAKKAPAKKPAAKKAPAKKRTAKKPVEKVIDLHVQFGGKEVSYTSLVENVKAMWKEQGKRESSMKSLNIYVKPEEFKAYYVINEKITGEIDL